MSAWIDKALNLGIRTTGRVEGTHALLKKQLESSELTLDLVVDNIRVITDKQLQALTQLQGVQRNSFPLDAPGNISGAVHNFLSHKAVHHTMEQVSLAENESLPPCTGLYRRSMGLPCAHELRNRQERMLQLSSFHEQWHLQCAGNTPLLPDPLPKPARRSFEYLKRGCTTSTVRILTTAELQQAALKRSEEKKRKAEEKEKKQREKQQKQHQRNQQRQQEVSDGRQQVLQPQVQEEEGVANDITWIQPMTALEMQGTGQVPQRIVQLDRVDK